MFYQNPQGREEHPTTPQELTKSILKPLNGGKVEQMRRTIEDVLKSLEEQAKPLDPNARAKYLCGIYSVKTKNGGFSSDNVQTLRRMINKAIKSL